MSDNIYNILYCYYIINKMKIYKLDAVTVKCKAAIKASCIYICV